MTEATRVLLHGFTGCAESWLGVIEELPAAIPVVTVDLFGHEITRPERLPESVVHLESCDGVVGETFDDEVDRLAVLLRAAGLARCHVVGYSMGGRVALGLLVRHQELFTRGTLIGAHPGLESHEERRQRAQQDERWIRLLEDEGLEAFYDAWRLQPLFASQKNAPEAFLRRQAEMRTRHDPLRVAAAMRRLGLGSMPHYGSRLGDLDLPMELIVGGLDTKFCTVARAMADVLPDGMVHFLGGIGHNAILESPRMVAALVGSHKEDQQT